MDITLSPDLEAFVERKIGEGGYRNAREVIEEGLRLLAKQDALERLRAEVRIGFEQIERGEVVDYTSGYMDRKLRESREHIEQGLPIRDAVLP